MLQKVYLILYGAGHSSSLFLPQTKSVRKHPFLRQPLHFSSLCLPPDSNTPFISFPIGYDACGVTVGFFRASALFASTRSASSSTGIKPPALNPFTWDDLIDIVQKKGNPSLLSRSEAVTRSSKARTAYIREHWASSSDYILCKIFERERRLVVRYDVQGNDGAVLPKHYWEASPRLSELVSAGTVSTRLVPNDFPYYVDRGIDHHVLWKIGGEVSEDDVNCAVETLREGAPEDDLEGMKMEFMSLINPVHLRSVPEIDYAHILSRQCPKEA
uniref:Uncharacterized protein n=1 Tax=Corethron hystrix TaxID=216773 RepID=A0A6U5I4V4_9STRA|mmetsp:Transcript_32688/g.75240  ORF Transcript_32688/g.75240 Transcript_32688/m.75240 type:complete len:272 (+) Transcript_32688:144-959(+)